MFERALELEPEFAAAHAGRAYTHIIDYTNGWGESPGESVDRAEEAVASFERRVARNAESDVSRVWLAASYGCLGRIEDARAAWAEALKLNPDYSLEHRRKVLPFKDPADFDRLLEGLAKAGIP